MTAEEKAKSLFKRMSDLHWRMADETAKRAAIVVCDEVIRELNDIVFNYDFENTPSYAHPSKTVISFWHKVKKHIEDNY